MSRKQRSVEPVPIASSPPHRVTLSPPHGLMLAWLAALLVARWLMPTEGAGAGMTLWLVQLVLLTAVGRTVWSWRFGDERIRFDAIDYAMASLVVAQVVSALVVVCGVGNSRAAINLAWEWIGSGVLIGMLRRELRGSRDIKSLCWGLSLAACVLAGYGLWQHYVVFGEMTRDYERLTTEHDQLAESKSDPRRQQTLRTEMTRQGIPIDPAARQSLEHRLLASREPFGLFALANTFAGLLAVMLLVVAGQMRHSSVNRRWSGNVVVIGLILVIGFCLVLTKSRTAWVGLAAGIGWWVLRVILARRRVHDAKTSRSSFATWVVVGLVVIGITIGMAAVSGGLDKAVVSEAPKSLRYRLEYWQGTWATIREHFWFGTGPGNFRDHYLAHKLPESSEEIADPHNFLFDVWANAGTFGLVAMLACVGLMAGLVFNRPTSKSIDAAGAVEDRPSEAAWTSPAAWGVGLAFPLAAIGLDLLGHGTDERLWWLGGIWWLLWLGGAAWSWRNPAGDSGGETNWLPFSLEAANVALLVHLLGAGGIAMPAITQMLWLIWGVRAAFFDASVTGREAKSPSESASGGVQAGRFPVLASVIVALSLCLACGLTATMPELLCRTSLQLGDVEWERRQVNAAQARYRDAAEGDRWAIEPLDRMAEISFLFSQHTQKVADFDEAVRRQQAVIDRLPFASRPYRRLGQAWMQRFETSHEIAHATKAVDALAAAVERYPHHAELLSEWAMACLGAEQIESARDAARRALRQDDINRRAGHSDKYLSESVRLRMQRLAADVVSPDAN